MPNPKARCLLPGSTQQEHKGHKPKGKEKGALCQEMCVSNFDTCCTHHESKEAKKDDDPSPQHDNYPSLHKDLFF